ncbi:MAG TPA: elongation factor P [Candidatus Dormibacteraeota bacterium]|nr:elongation factor P [Candidatus Dormibacteraeota bacterium]
MINAGELRSGTTVERNGQLWEVLSFEHVKLGRGTAVVRTRLRNITTGAVTEETFRPEERFPRARIEKVDVQFLYRDGQHYVVMDTQSFDQYPVDESHFTLAAQYIKESDHLFVLQYDGKVIGVELPITVELEVAQTDPGFKGDTATGGSKPATLDTGLVVDVPLFVETGDRLKVDTRTGKYLERVQ